MTTMTHPEAVTARGAARCDARLHDGSLVCVAGDHPGNPRGHIFQSSTGSYVDDKHSEGGHG